MAKRGLVFLEIVVELAAGAGLGDVAGADDEIAEPLALIAFARVALEDRAQNAGDFLLLGRDFVQFVEPVAGEAAAEVDVVLARRTANEGNLRDVRPGAAVRAAGHADGDRFLLESDLPEPGDVTVTNKVFFEIDINGERAGRVEFGLYGNHVPRTAENFRQLCVGAPGFGYKGATFHRIIPGFMNQAGATRGGSIYGGQFEDGSFVHAHDEPFLLSMANSGPDTNADQFFITVDPQPHLDGKHQVFGTVVEGEDVVMAVNEVGTGGFAGTPKERVVIVDAGEIP